MIPYLTVPHPALEHFLTERYCPYGRTQPGWMPTAINPSANKSVARIFVTILKVALLMA
jgi:hypothetical protein